MSDRSMLAHHQVLIRDTEPTLIAEARDRNDITLISMSPDAVFVGGREVTVETGFPLPIGVPVPIKSCGEIWGIAKVHGTFSTSNTDRARSPTKSRICFLETFNDPK